MPTTPPPPTFSPVSGGSWASGAGFTQTSGTPAVYAEYTQWLTIQYTRNPQYTQRNPTNDYRSLVELSGVDSFNVNASELHFIITVHNSCKFITSHFQLSASLQMQELVLNAKKFDKVGYSYGEVSGANNAYVFGPVGAINTKKPYIRRDIKTSADVEYSLTQVGVSHSLAVTGPGDATVWGNGSMIAQPYSNYLNAYGDIITGSDFPRSKRSAGNTFQMQGGGYNTSSESGFGDNDAGISNLIMFVEANCGELGNASFHERFPIPIPTVSDGFSWIQLGDRLAINPYYVTSRHDYK